MAEKPKESLADLKKDAYRIDPTVLGQAALGPVLSESLLPERGPPLSVEEWRARNEPGRFDPVEASIALVGGPRGRGVRAYHSSPHDFERFDIGKVGIGEGHQSFGHGLYFAENPEVSGQGGSYWRQFKGRFSEPERIAADYLAITRFNREHAVEATRQAIQSNPNHGALREALRLLESGKPVGPRTYEVNIKAQPEQFVQWERPANKQSPAVEEALSRIGIDYANNPLAMQRALREGGGDRELAAMGLPGIRYSDAGLRKQGQGSSNYVVFNDKIIDILKKYGIVGAVGGAAATKKDKANADN